MEENTTLNTGQSTENTNTPIDKIQLKDGTVLNLPLNGNTYESEEALPASLFSVENLSSVKINDIPKGRMVLICYYPFGSGTRFALREETKQEKWEEEIGGTISAITGGMSNPQFIGQQINRAVQLVLEGTELEDEKAMEVADLYPEWEPQRSYTDGMVVKYGVNEDNETQLYRVVQNHTSQADWQPDKTPSLYKKVGYDGDIPIWTQPYGDTDAYAKGDKVSHKGKIWVSDIDYNVWEPGVAMWTELLQ